MPKRAPPSRISRLRTKRQPQVSASTNAKLKQAIAHHQQGRLTKAEALYKEILRNRPEHFNSLYLLGVIRRQQGNPEAAVALIDDAIAINPDHAVAWSSRGLALCDLARYEEALGSYDRALVLQPDFAEALTYRGDALLALKRPEEALASYDRALAMQPKYAEALSNRGKALLYLKRPEEALASFDHALVSQPNFAEALTCRGTALLDLMRPEEALASYDRALALQPKYVEALSNRGNALLYLRRPREALASYDRAMALRPEHATALLNRGLALIELKRYEDALVTYASALALKPDFAEALSSRGTALMEMGEQDAALDSFREAIQSNPALISARFKLLIAHLPPIATCEGDIERSRNAFSQELAVLEEWFAANSVNNEQDAVGAAQPFYLAYQERNNRDLLERYGKLCSMLMLRWQQRNAIPIKASFPLPEKKSRLRLGIVSAQIRDDSVFNAIVRGWLENLDRDRFEITTFYLGTDQNNETALAKRSSGHFEFGVKGLKHWAQSIASRDIDILIYPEIGMDVVTVQLASMRLAPLQVTTWGHPETSGLPTIDYFLSAEGFEPAGSQDCYTEKLVHLPNFGCYYDKTNVVAARKAELGKMGISDARPLFVCPGTPFKYTPQHDAIFVEIARRLGTCQFVFFAFDKLPALSQKLLNRLAAAFEAAHLDHSKHIVFVDWQEKPVFHSVMNQADVFLDTIGFSGFNTAMQAVECNLPIVAKEGRFMRGRFGSAIMKRLGIPECVAHDNTSYIECAIRLARDHALRDRVRMKMQSSKDVLFRDLASIRALEVILSELVERGMLSKA